MIEREMYLMKHENEPYGQLTIYFKTGDSIYLRAYFPGSPEKAIDVLKSNDDWVYLEKSTGEIDYFHKDAINRINYKPVPAPKKKDEKQ